IRLVDQRSPLESRGHFMAVAATQMRRILLDYARKHRAARRGGNDQKVLLEDTMVISEQQPVDMIALNTALDKLASLDSRQSQLVELRFFGGLSVEETAGVMGISPATVKRDWSSARAFLHREITGVRAAGIDE
ncbi:MAG: ECF-type sigma factor, partial [Bryobacteraceae bacterium]